MTIQEAAEQYAQGIKSDKSAVLQVADEFATITRYKKYVTHYESLKKAAGYEWVKVGGVDEEIAKQIFREVFKEEYVEMGSKDSHSYWLRKIKEIIAIGRQQDKWVSVEDRLPETNVTVIGFTNKGRIILTWIDRGTLQFEDLEIDEDDYFTHWQPLPSPPKTDKP